MKKILCLILCLTLLAMSVTAFAKASVETAKADGVSGFSAPEVYIIPSEKSDVSAYLEVATFSKPQTFVCAVPFKNIRQENKYFPDVLEQIDIISVAPRE